MGKTAIPHDHCGLVPCNYGYVHGGMVCNYVCAWSPRHLMVSSVSFKGLYGSLIVSRVCPAWEDQIRYSGTIDSMTGLAVCLYRGTACYTPNNYKFCSLIEIFQQFLRVCFTGVGVKVTLLQTAATANPEQWVYPTRGEEETITQLS